MQYLQLACTLKYYGYLQFAPCHCDYPQPDTRVLISAGGRELNFRLALAQVRHTLPGRGGCYTRRTRKYFRQPPITGGCSPLSGNPAEGQRKALVAVVSRGVQILEQTNSKQIASFRI